MTKRITIELTEDQVYAVQDALYLAAMRTENEDERAFLSRLKTTLAKAQNEQTAKS